MLEMSEAQPIKIAILAMGGEGGGVLANWIVALGEGHGYLAQSTSVPGVAQRTGATIYYVELFPQAAADAAGARPVLALMPLPGDVDIVLASELMEAGRAVQRGLVTPERTTLVASTHRVYAIAEKVVPGDGRADGATLLAHAGAAARRLVAFDMAQVAERSGSAISAVLFGALAGSGALPFDRAQFESTIAAGGVGGAASLRAFAQGFDRATRTDATRVEDEPVAALRAEAVAQPRDPAIRALLERARQDFGGELPSVVLEGLRRLVDYQDVAYAHQYLDRLAPLRGFGDATLVDETARHLALWMAYEDTIRVADLKTRDSRFERVRAEVRAGPDQGLAIEEFLHPRVEEIADTLPARWGRRLLASGGPRRWLERRFAHGRVVRTNTLRGFALLRSLAALRRWRRGTLRFAVEQSRIDEWLAEVAGAAGRDRALAIEIARCQRLVKGYGDTHARGWAKFEALRAAWRQEGIDAARLAARREAALATVEGGLDEAP